MNERRMIKKLNNGNAKALQKLIETYSAYVSSVIYSIIGTYMTAEDIEETMADVFLEIWKHPEKLNEGKVKSFLAAVARNLARNKLRERKVEISIDENDFLLLDDRFEAEIDSNERAEIISDALKVLTEQERDIFIRYYYLEHTAKMISESLEIPVSTITSRLSRGRKKIKEHLIKKGIVHS